MWTKRNSPTNVLVQLFISQWRQEKKASQCQKQQEHNPDCSPAKKTVIARVAIRWARFLSETWV